MRSYWNAAVAAAMLTLIGPSILMADLVSFTWAGEVGTNASATDPVVGTAFGNSIWRLNGTNLAAGTEISFNYTIDSSAADLDASSTAGRFTGGTFTTTIASMGIVNVNSVESYDLSFIDTAIRDAVQAIPTDNTGFEINAHWDPGTNPWSDVNSVGSLPNQNAESILGSSPNGEFTLNLASGDVLTTGFSELLDKGSFSSVPEPAAATMLGACVLGLVLRRRRS